jgi:hypothetical protein
MAHIEIYPTYSRTYVVIVRTSLETTYQFTTILFILGVIALLRPRFARALGGIIYELNYVIVTALFLTLFVGYLQTETRSEDVPRFSYVQTTSLSPNYTTYRNRGTAHAWI